MAAPVAVDPHGTGTIYVASVGGGVRKSIDEGATWSTVNSGLSTTALYAVAVDASGPQTVYAGGFGGGGLFKSIDGGLNWMPLGPVGIVNSLAADPHTPGVVFMGLLGGAIRRSTNGGATWQPVFSGAGIEIRVSAEIAWGSASSRSFVVHTSLKRSEVTKQRHESKALETQAHVRAGHSS